MTVKGTSRSWICAPVGSVPGKRFRATVLPSTATRRIVRWSTSLKNVPYWSPQSRIV
jgi:hypothetical protein